MQLNELIANINYRVEELDFVSARKLIEENMELIQTKKHHLRGNARELYDFLSSNSLQTLNRREMSIIASINSYASKFDIRGLKVSLKSNARLLMREDVRDYLNADAKILLEGMGALPKS